MNKEKLNKATIDFTWFILCQLPLSLFILSPVTIFLLSAFIAIQKLNALLRLLRLRIDLLRHNITEILKFYIFQCLYKITVESLRQDCQISSIFHHNHNIPKTLITNSLSIRSYLYFLQVIQQYRQGDMQEQNYSQLNNRINSITCYLCGRDFGTKGLLFHHKECKIKFHNEQRLRQPKGPIKFPQAPQGIQHILEGNLFKIDLKAFNMKANQIYKYKVLLACKYCGRTFNPESLDTHMKGCNKEKAFKEQKQNHSLPSFKVPKNLVCCVCGQRFGTFSLKIHYPECTKKFHDDQYRKHKKQSDRRKPPQLSKEEEELIKVKTEWSDSEIESFNNRSNEIYRDKGMAECSNCKRKFFDEQLPKHQKNCILINGLLNTVEKIDKKEAGPRKPKTIMCVICGRQYGLASISIHIQNCAELFQKQQSLKHKSQKKLLPQLPQQLRESYNLKQAEVWPLQKLQAYNKVVSNIYNTKSLSKCYICSRTFFEQSLPKHLKECETKIKDIRKLEKFKQDMKSKSGHLGQNLLENIMQMNKQLNKFAQRSTVKPKMLMCYLCGRQYGLSSLKIHVPQCKLKPINSKKFQSQSFKTICEEIQNKYEIGQAESWAIEQIQAYNQQVYHIYKKESLFACKFCNRTFFQESLKKHIKHCQKDYIKEGAHKGSKLKRAQTMMNPATETQQYCLINKSQMIEQVTISNDNEARQRMIDQNHTFDNMSEPNLLVVNDTSMDCEQQQPEKKEPMIQGEEMLNMSINNMQ